MLIIRLFYKSEENSLFSTILGNRICAYRRMTDRFSNQDLFDLTPFNNIDEMKSSLVEFSVLVFSLLKNKLNAGEDWLVVDYMT